MKQFESLLGLRSDFWRDGGALCRGLHLCDELVGSGGAVGDEWVEVQRIRMSNGHAEYEALSQVPRV